MLQQTRVAAVIPYYERFLAKFPTMQALARAKTETVLGALGGPRLLQPREKFARAAKEIVARHGGRISRATMKQRWPCPASDATRLRRCLSIAYDEPLAVLDGNVARVLARIGAVRGDLRAPAVWRKLEAAAQDLLARNAPGDWNQAMMELGATVCTPKSPRCGECPVAGWCRARKLGMREQLPAARKKRATVQGHAGRGRVAGSRWAARCSCASRTATARYFRACGNSPRWKPPRDAASDLARYLREKFGIAANGCHHASQDRAAHGDVPQHPPRAIPDPRRALAAR